MIKLFCDKCKKEIESKSDDDNPVHFWNYWSLDCVYGDETQKEYRLCKKCNKEIQDGFK